MGRLKTPTFLQELGYLNNYRFIAGIDEVGRAPLAGPVISAVVILNPQKVGCYRSRHKWWMGVRDSKTLSPRKRGSIVNFIKQNAYDFGIGIVTHKEIDELNIHEATLLSMRRAIESLKIQPEIVLVDGRFIIDDLRIKQKAIIDGDAYVLSIAAASILAKVFRDDLMKKYSQEFSQYGFENHKGYDTKFHRKKLLEYGPCEIHRMSFVTVREIVNQRFRKMLE